MPCDGQVYPEVIRCHVMARFNRRFIRCHVMDRFTRRFIRCHVMAEFTRRFISFHVMAWSTWRFISCQVMAGSTWRFISCHVMAGCNHRFISCHRVVTSGLLTVYDGYMDGTLLISEYGITILILMVMVHVMVTSLHGGYTCFMIGLCCVQFRL